MRRIPDTLYLIDNVRIACEVGPGSDEARFEHVVVRFQQDAKRDCLRVS